MSRLSRLKPSRDEWVDLGVVLVLTGLAVLAFRSSYGGARFLLVGLVGAVLGLVVAHLAARLRWPLVVTVATAVVLYAVAGAVVALRDQTIAGVLPTPAAIVDALRTTVTGWKELVTTTPPVGSTGTLMVLPFAGAMVCSLTAYLLARRFRSPLVGVVPPAVLLGVGIATGTNDPVSLVIHGAVFGAVGVAWVAWREHQRRPLLQVGHANHRQAATAVGMLVVASAVGFVVAPQLPMASANERSIWRQTVTPPFDPRQYPSPLSGYRRYVKEPSYKEQVMFTVEGLPEGVPVRLATMDEYDGLVFQVSAGDPDNPSLNDSGSFERVGASVPPEFPGETAEVTVTIGKYSDVWVPDVGEVISLRFTGSTGGSARDRQLAESFRYNRATDTGAVRVRLREGDRYVMQVRLPEAVDELAAETMIPVVARIGRTASVPEVVQKLVSEDLLAIKNTGERLDRVAQAMIEDGTYSDGDRNAAKRQQPSRSGHSRSRLGEFVGRYPDRPLIGNAEQYATTFALLFRDLDRVPTRVVMGFRPSGDSTAGPVEVRAREVEAWVEVPVEEKGWVAVFPTPPRDQVALTKSTTRDPEPDYRTQSPPPPPVLDPEFEQPATAKGKAKATKPKAEDEDDDAEAAGSSQPVPVWVVAGGGMLGVPMLALFTGSMVIVGLKGRRRRGRRRHGAGHERIANGWREVTDFATDTGRALPPAVTRREAAAFIGGDTTALAHRADAAVWGGGECTDDDVDRYWDELVQTLKSMRSEMGLVDRIKTSISVRSLRLRDILGRRQKTGEGP